MVFDLLERLFNRNKTGSATVAKDRLKMVLAVDRTEIAPQTIEQIRKEILDVIVRYFEIDENEKFDVTLERERGSTAIIANVPIRRIRPEHI
ncbi:MAG: cell division topological specificity factor MinE [Aphanocapsa lilacina HA4352-LM1]|jgi:cell division topological specificity factor|uniref:Cell division topological specificity factor n=2 Tax=Gloeobacter TaxID=33071 RepID=MINE_GLOVI|nr:MULTISPECIES: cell division topological specificity factor MinE [Gloeobacter]Q7NJ38.1 RecName: Full=Cell division topological specificity factor [Gloeobacter violaceus PCC 7421]MBW4696863.1 cell division topological specificity factor MinE [Aphanocapsa lilacina HA4352-LM1]UFP94797.1 cell division topological specificity factor MinE [Gloeobacter morelensis MG652769]BAC89935.1 septum site-determining protein [Gloeobacter violaceus PCC 7421]